MLNYTTTPLEIDDISIANIDNVYNVLWIIGASSLLRTVIHAYWVFVKSK